MSGQVSKCKVFIDYPAYFRAIGQQIQVFDGSNQQMTGDDLNDVFTLNPSETKEFYWDGQYHNMDFICALGDPNNTEIRKLNSSINYVALLNHNFYSFHGLTDTDAWHRMGGCSIANDSVGFHDFNQISLVNTGAPLAASGFYLASIDSNGWTDSNNYGFSYAFNIESQTSDPLKLGAISVGRSFSFPYNADVNMSISYNADGIKKSRSKGGRDIVDVNYYRQPDWDGRMPFVRSDTKDLIPHVGNRSWDLTFSYLSADDTFPQDMGENFMFDNVFTQEGMSVSWLNHGTENIISHFMGLSLNGQIPFIFQPSDAEDTFAMCRLRSNSFSVQQSAPNLYTCKMIFDETRV